MAKKVDTLNRLDYVDKVGEGVIIRDGKKYDTRDPKQLAALTAARKAAKKGTGTK